MIRCFLCGIGLLLTLVYVRRDRDKVVDGARLPRRSLFTLTLKRFGLNAFGNTQADWKKIFTLTLAINPYRECIYKYTIHINEYPDPEQLSVDHSNICLVLGSDP